MAKLISPSRVTAICLLTALFGVCVMNPVPVEDPELFKKLNAATDLKSVEQLLNGVKNPHSVTLRGNTVAIILNLKVTDCELEKLSAAERVFDVYKVEESENKGLIIFFKHYLKERLTHCAKILTDGAKAQLDKLFTEPQRTELSKFFADTYLEILRLQEREENKDDDHDEVKYFFMALDRLSFTPEKLQSIRNNCNRLVGIRWQIEPELLWPDFPFKPTIWSDIGPKCWMLLSKAHLSCESSAKKAATEDSGVPSEENSWYALGVHCLNKVVGV